MPTPEFKLTSTYLIQYQIQSRWFLRQEQDEFDSLSQLVWPYGLQQMFVHFQFLQSAAYLFAMYHRKTNDWDVTTKSLCCFNDFQSQISCFSRLFISVRQHQVSYYEVNLPIRLKNIHCLRHIRGRNNLKTF